MTGSETVGAFQQLYSANIRCRNGKKWSYGSASHVNHTPSSCLSTHWQGLFLLVYIVSHALTGGRVDKTIVGLHSRGTTNISWIRINLRLWESKNIFAADGMYLGCKHRDMVAEGGRPGSELFFPTNFYTWRMLTYELLYLTHAKRSQTIRLWLFIALSHYL